jgi:hypothetical protein
MLAPRRTEVTGGWRKLYNEEFNNLYSPPNIIRMVKSRLMSLAVYVAGMEGKRNPYGLLVGTETKETTRKTKTKVGGYTEIYLRDKG